MKKLFLLCLLPFFSRSQNISFSAEGLIFLNDADLSAFCLDDGIIRNDNEGKDFLSGLQFPLVYGANKQINSVAVSNSMVGSQKSVALTSDQQKAYILESRGSVKGNSTNIGNTIKNLPKGKYVTVADVSSLTNVKALYRFPVGENASSISLDPSNKNLLICSEEPNKEILVYELDYDGKPIRIIKKPQKLNTGRIVHASWDPSGNYIIYLNKDAGEIGVLKALKDGPTGQIIRLESFGSPTKINGHPIYGSFTPDARYFIVLDSKTELSKTSPEGQLFVIKLNLDSDQVSAALLSKINIPRNSTTFDIHPDGSHIAVISAENSFEIPNNLSNNEGSISLYSLSLSGNMKLLQKKTIEGVLPSSVAFDKTGENIAVSIYQYLTYGNSFGGVEFFKFKATEDQILTKQKGKIYLQAGVHSVTPLFNY